VDAYGAGRTIRPPPRIVRIHPFGLIAGLQGGLDEVVAPDR
jgi:hypothetical protein